MSNTGQSPSPPTYKQCLQRQGNVEALLRLPTGDQIQINRKFIEMSYDCKTIDDYETLARLLTTFITNPRLAYPSPTQMARAHRMVARALEDVKTDELNRRKVEKKKEVKSH